MLLLSYPVYIIAEKLNILQNEGEQLMRIKYKNNAKQMGQISHWLIRRVKQAALKWQDFSVIRKKAPYGAFLHCYKQKPVRRLPLQVSH